MLRLLLMFATKDWNDNDLLEAFAQKYFAIGQAFKSTRASVWGLFSEMSGGIPAHASAPWVQAGHAELTFPLGGRAEAKRAIRRQLQQ